MLKKCIFASIMTRKSNQLDKGTPEIQDAEGIKHDEIIIQNASDNQCMENITAEVKNDSSNLAEKCKEVEEEFREEEEKCYKREGLNLNKKYTEENKVEYAELLHTIRGMRNDVAAIRLLLSILCTVFFVGFSTVSICFLLSSQTIKSQGATYEQELQPTNVEQHIHSEYGENSSRMRDYQADEVSPVEHSKESAAREQKLQVQDKKRPVVKSEMSDDRHHEKSSATDKLTQQQMGPQKNNLLSLVLTSDAPEECCNKLVREPLSQIEKESSLQVSYEEGPQQEEISVVTVAYYILNYYQYLLILISVVLASSMYVWCVYVSS